MFRVELYHSIKVTAECLVCIGDHQFKRDVRLTEVEDKVPEDIPVLPQLVQVSLLQTAIVDVNLEVYLD